jgi:hypothetical protein
VVKVLVRENDEVFMFVFGIWMKLKTVFAAKMEKVLHIDWLVFLLRDSKLYFTSILF